MRLSLILVILSPTNETHHIHKKSQNFKHLIKFTFKNKLGTLLQSILLETA